MAMIPPEIDPTGVADVTDRLARFLNTVPDGTVIDWPDDAQYRINGTVVLTDKFGLEFRGHDAELFTMAQGDHNRCQLQLVGGGDYVIRDLKLRGANVLAGRDGLYDLNYEGQHCLFTQGVHGACIVGCEMSMSYGDLIYFGGRKVGASGTAGNRDWTRDIWVYDCDLHHSGRQGITFQGVRDTVVTRNRIYELRRSTFEFEPKVEANNGASGIHITFNEIGLGRLNLLANHGSGPVSDIWVEDNVVARPLNITVHDESGARSRSGFHVNRNRCTAGLGGAPWCSVMEFINVDGVEVANNIQAMKPNRNMALVNTTDCTDVKVAGNQLPGAAMEVRALSAA